jgi:hypothetical protein
MEGVSSTFLLEHILSAAKGLTGNENCRGKSGFGQIVFFRAVVSMLQFLEHCAQDAATIVATATEKAATATAKATVESIDNNRYTLCVLLQDLCTSAKGKGRFDSGKQNQGLLSRTSICAMVVRLLDGKLSTISTGSHMLDQLLQTINVLANNCTMKKQFGIEDICQTLAARLEEKDWSYGSDALLQTCKLIVNLSYDPLNLRAFRTLGVANDIKRLRLKHSRDRRVDQACFHAIEKLLPAGKKFDHSSHNITKSDYISANFKKNDKALCYGAGILLYRRSREQPGTVNILLGKCDFFGLSLWVNLVFMTKVFI